PAARDETAHERDEPNTDQHREQKRPEAVVPDQEPGDNDSHDPDPDRGQESHRIASGMEEPAEWPDDQPCDDQSDDPHGASRFRNDVRGNVTACPGALASSPRTRGP